MFGKSAFNNDHLPFLKLLENHFDLSHHFCVTLNKNYFWPIIMWGWGLLTPKKQKLWVWNLGLFENKQLLLSAKVVVFSFHNAFFFPTILIKSVFPHTKKKLLYFDLPVTEKKKTGPVFLLGKPKSPLARLNVLWKLFLFRTFATFSKNQSLFKELIF